MARTNPEVERLTRECALLRRQLDALTSDPGDRASPGCGDSGCIVAQPGGMCTNGGCRCEARALRMALQHSRRVEAFLRATVRAQRDEIADLRSMVPS